MKIIYVIGAGRSGSTLFDTVLGNNSNIVGVGELSQIQKLGYLEKERCSCGEILDDCTFFSRVEEIYSRKTGDSDYSYYENLRRKIENKSNWFFLVFNLVNADVMHEYCKRTNALFESIAEASGKDYILDSSKKFTRLVAMSFCDNINIIPIHLVRNCFGFVNSQMKKQVRNGFADKVVHVEPSSSAKAALHWSVVNLSSLVSLLYYKKKKGQKNYLLVRYEDFCMSTPKILERLSEITLLNFDDINAQVDNSGNFDIYHKVGGNLMKYNRKLQIKYDDNWKSALPILHKIVALIISWPILLIYLFLFRNK